MPTYLARVTVHADLDQDQVDGMADALGAARTEPDGGEVVLWVPGEAPDLTTAELAARRHAAEVLDGYRIDVEVAEDTTR
jgi:hypothetical protein